MRKHTPLLLVVLAVFLTSSTINAQNDASKTSKGLKPIHITTPAGSATIAEFDSDKFEDFEKFADFGKFAEFEKFAGFAKFAAFEKFAVFEKFADFKKFADLEKLSDVDKLCRIPNIPRSKTK